VVVTSEYRFDRTPEGAVWTVDGPAYPFWTRYLSAFDEVRVVARVRECATPARRARRVDGDRVGVWPLPYYRGPAQYLLRRRAVGRAVRAATGPADAAILRVPSPIGTLLAQARARQGRPYALEVIGDPYDVLAPGTVEHPLRPLMRTLSTRHLRRQCRRAAAVSYVTEHALQARYPAGPAAVTGAYSGVDLPAEAFVPAGRRVVRVPPCPALVCVGTLEQLYKGVDVLLRAVSHLVARGTPVRLTHVGDGRYRPHVEALAARLGVADRVTFVGAVPAGEAVRRHLDRADLFVLPSRTEGLPRALIEAMARALPAVATAVGGIPELLPPADLVPAGDAAALARVVAAVLGDPARMTVSSARNLRRAHDYATTSLAGRRDAFYRAVASRTRTPTVARDVAR
jgi:glycosyltransferase involved in cell wall biosynthesis